MKKIITNFFALVIGANFFIVSAQKVNIIKSDSLNPQMKKIAKDESVPNWIKFKNDIKIDPKTIFIDYKSEFDLTENDKMILYNTIKDDLGFTLFQYQQYYKNIKVDGAVYNVHVNKNGVVNSANGRILSRININVVPVVKNKQAIDIALKYVNAKEYMWQSVFWEKNLKERTKKIDTTFFPTPQLVIRKISNRNSLTKNQDKIYFLVYCLDIHSSSPFYSQRIFIDANTGKVLESLPLQSN